MTGNLKPVASAARVEDTRCCPPFDPATWSTEPIVWHDKPFVTDNVHCLFHVPLDFGQRVTKNQRLIEAAGASPERPMILSADTSPWASELYMEVTRPVPGARMTTLSGTFSTHVYEGPYRDVGAWIADMRHRLEEQKQQLQKLYIGYTTCPRCAKAYGKNYVILFAQVAGARSTADAA